MESWISRCVALCLCVFSFFKLALAQETCIFNDGDASVAVFCDDGCCTSQCCGDSDVDETAIAIAIASVIGLLLVVIFLLLLCYCYHRRNKLSEDEENNSRLAPRNNVHPEKPRKRHNFSQTGEQTYPSNRKDGTFQRDRLLEGNPSRWNSYNPYPRPLPTGPKGPIMHRQTQTGNPKGVPPPNGPDLFAASRAMKSNLVPAPEPHVPAPYWRYHKKGPGESKDVYSLMEKKALWEGGGSNSRAMAKRKGDSVYEAPPQLGEREEPEVISDGEMDRRTPRPSLSD